MKTNNKPRLPPQEVLDYVKAKIQYNPETGQLNKGGIHNSGYWLVPVTIDYVRYNLQGHHVVWFLCKGIWPEYQLDHKDLDKLNNCIDNLEYSDGHAQQSNNRQPRTLPIGVSKTNIEYESYKAEITYDGTKHYLGSFPTPEEASIRYQDALKQQRANQRERE